MLKLWIYLTFLCIGIAALAENKYLETSGEFYDDYPSNVAENSNEDNEKPPNSLSEEIEDLPKTTNFSNEELSTEIKNESSNFVPDRQVIDDYTKTGSSVEHFTATEEANIGDEKKMLEGVIDYQIEDNRSEENDNINKDEYDLQSFSDAKDSLDLSDMNDLDLKTLSEEIKQEMNDEFSEADNRDDKSNSIEMIQQILEDTKQVLANDNGNDFAEDVSIKDEANKNITTAYKTIIDETKIILKENEENFDEQSRVRNIDGSDESILNEEENNIDNKDDEFIAELIELNNIKNKLNDFEVEGNSLQDEGEHVISSEENDEGDYEKIDDDNFDQIFEKYEEHDVEPLPDDVPYSEEIIKNEPILYKNDDLLPNDIEKTKPVTEQISAETSAFPLTSTIAELNSEEFTKPSKTYMDTNSMTDSQIDRLLIDFTGKNIENIVSSARSSNNPERVWLSVDKPTVVSSPGYPDPYPTNSVTDWIFEGIGTGIELNITDCDINGHVGDYLLVKPGDIDDSGNNGIIFTYNLNTERRYRFLDADRMFMRFHANVGSPFMRGFSISAKMIVQAPTILESEPDAEPSVEYPEHTLTLNLGGISLEGFIKVEEQFRQIIADMATMYINANNITTEVNNTLGVTQIVSKALCFHNWPKYEMCAEVKFGVPLFFEDGQRARLDEEDLHTMWFQYYDQDPFAVRLRLLGITEFQVPNDHGVLLVWLVIAGGVVISMIMLAFALWRYSCFEDYSRMPTYSDTDSLTDKRRLDMFPTPHQTLPPLYTDADYKWVDNDEPCKVDIGGYSNRNFLDDDMFDIDSEDEVVPGRNRDTAIRPQDIYSV